MIKFLEVKNFQSHKNTRFDFVPGVNVLVGLSQSGKTAGSQRSMKLLKDNRPLGASAFFPRDLDKGETEVVAGLTEGREVSIKKKVSRDKKGGKPIVRSSTYVLDSKEYAGFKDKVPDEVRRALNFSELNFQEQLDGPFLICSSPSEVAKRFNKITNLDKIDEYKSDLNKKVLRINAEIEIGKDQLKEKREELSQYDGLSDVEDLVDRADRVQQRIDSLEYEWHAITDILNKHDDISEEEEKWNGVLGIEVLVDEAVEIQELLEVEKKVIEEVRFLIEQIKACDGAMAVYIRILSIEDPVKDARELIDLIDKVDFDLMQVGQIVGDIEEVDRVLQEAEERKKELIGEYVQMLEELRKCPTCFSPVEEEDIKRIVREVER